MRRRIREAAEAEERGLYAHEKPCVPIVTGYPAAGARVPRLAKLGLDEVLSVR